MIRKTSPFELGREDFLRGELPTPNGDGPWGERRAGWEAAFAESLAEIEVHDLSAWLDPTGENIAPELLA